MTSVRCTCDDFCDCPCPVHGFGEMACECGRSIRAPLVAYEGWELHCDCGKHYVGMEDGAHGHWRIADKREG